MEFLVTYDIATQDRAGQRRLQRVARICEGFGLRVQYSVFECRLTAARHQALLAELRQVIDPATDSINIYEFPGQLRSSRCSLGRLPTSTAAGPWMV